MDPERGPCVRSIAFPWVLLWFWMCFVESMYVRFEGRLAEHGVCPYIYIYVYIYIYIKREIERERERDLFTSV